MMITEIKVMGDSNKEYTITAKDQTHVTCSCPSFMYRGGVCKHIAFVLDQMSSASALA